MLYVTFLLLCLLLPFQFATGLVPGYDLAIVRFIIPILFLGWLVALGKKKVPFPGLTWPLISLGLFLFLAAFSITFSQNLFWSARKLLFLFSIAPIYLLTLSFTTKPEGRKKVLLALVVGASLAAIVGVVQFSAQFFFSIEQLYAFWGKHIAPFFLGQNFSATVLAYPSWLINSEGTTYLRAFAFFPDPHMFSYYLGMLLPWSIAMVYTNFKNRHWFILSSVLIAIADVFTFTRGSYVALILTSIIILPLVSRLVKVKIILGVAALILLYFVVPTNPVTERLASSFNTNEGSNQGRIYNWKQSIPVILENPLGVGIGNYPLAVKKEATYREPIYAHNAYLDVAAELGLETAFVFVTFLGFSFFSLWIAAKRKRDPLFVAGAASVSIFAIHSLVENPLYSVHVLTLFLIVMAISNNLVHANEPRS